MKTLTLDLDQYITWRKPDRTLTISFASGDTVVLTVSKNGHDATASHLSHSSEPFKIPVNAWYTAETLGSESVLRVEPDDYTEVIAPPDWRPSPREPMQ